MLQYLAIFVAKTNSRENEKRVVKVSYKLVFRKINLFKVCDMELSIHKKVSFKVLTIFRWAFFEATHKLGATWQSYMFPWKDLNFADITILHSKSATFSIISIKIVL